MNTIINNPKTININNASQNYLKVESKNKISGLLNVSGAKNSALVLMAASLLTDKPLFINNVPSLADINSMSKLLISCGKDLKFDKNRLEITNREGSYSEKDLSKEIFSSLRAGFFCIGPLLTRKGKITIPLPGGCAIGERPIEEHLNGLRALGANIEIINNHVKAEIVNPIGKLTGAKIKLKCKSVGATETLIMAATLAKGDTIIENAAKEPEIKDLADMLNKMGAKIYGAGKSLILIKGVNNLSGTCHNVIPDRIEAGTLLIAAAIMRSSITIAPVVPEHIESLILKLEECGCVFSYSHPSLTINAKKELSGVKIVTSPFPGFPTDLQAPFMALMTTLNGISTIEETVFENRMQHVEELIRMGADIVLKDNIAYINGVNKLKATALTGRDLRSTAALILASLNAEGISIIQGLDHLNRGYENLTLKLNSVGTKISIISAPYLNNY